MYFDYLLYVDVCLIAAFQDFAISSIVILIIMIYLIEKRREKKFRLVYLIPFPLLIMVAGIILLQSGGMLMHGIYLFKEKEDDAVEISGEISKTKGINDFNRRFVGDEYGYDEISGTVFTIDGIKCIAPLNCNLKVGDHVFVRYLPQSGCILYISKVDDS